MAGPRKKPAVEKSGDNESMELDQVRTYLCIFMSLLFQFDSLGNSSRL